MTRATRSLRPAVAVCALALLACGGEPEPIPRDQAAALVADLEEVSRRVDAGACNDLRTGTFVRLDRRIERLPDEVDGDVQQALRDGAAHLEDLAGEECKANRQPPAATETPKQAPAVTPAPTTSTPPPVDQPKDEQDQAPTTPTVPPPKDPEPPADSPGGGTPSPSGDDEGGGGGGAVVIPPPVQRGLQRLERERRKWFER